MKTAVVILNWNTRKQLERWLPGIVESCRTIDGAKVIVADNGSDDGSRELLHTSFPDIGTILLDRNYGFTGGYNRALSQLMSDNPELEYAVLLNSDIEVDDNWLEPLVTHMDSNPNCAACGPKLLQLSDDGDCYRRTDRFEYAGAAGGYIDKFGYPFCRGRVLKMTESDTGQYDTPRNVLWVSGACMMVRTSLWGRGLDERFFAHMEEIDWCWRKQTEGYAITTVPSSRVWHLGGGTLAPESPFKLKLNYRNNLLLLENNLPATCGIHKARLILASRKSLDILSAIAYLLSGSRARFKAVLDAHTEYRQLSGGLTERKGAEVTGYCRLCIIPQALLRKNRVFEYIRRYENSNCGSRRSRFASREDAQS